MLVNDEQKNGPLADSRSVIDNFFYFLKYYDYSKEWSILGLDRAPHEEQEEFAASFTPILIFLWKQGLTFVFPDLSSGFFDMFMARYQTGRDREEMRALRAAIDEVADLGSNDHGMILLALRCVNMVAPDAEDKNDMIVSLTERLLQLLERFATPEQFITELEIETLRVRYETRTRELASSVADMPGSSDSDWDLSDEGTGDAGEAEGALEDAPEKVSEESQPPSMDLPSDAPRDTGGGLVVLDPDESGKESDDQDEEETGRGDAGASMEDDGVTQTGGLGRFLDEQQQALNLDTAPTAPAQAAEKAAPEKLSASPQGFQELVDGVSGIPWSTDRKSAEQAGLELVKQCKKSGVWVYAKGNGYLFFSDRGLIQSSMKYSGVPFARQLDYIKELFELRGTKDEIDYYRKDDVIIKVYRKDQKISAIRKLRDTSRTAAIGQANAKATPSGRQAEAILEPGPDDESNCMSMPTGGAMGEEGFIKAFVLSFFKAKGVNNWIAHNIGFYADEVQYLSRGNIQKKDIAAEYLATQQQWPDRSYEVVGEPVITPTDNPCVRQVQVTCSYALKNRQETVSGNVKVNLVIEVKNGKGCIISEQEQS